MAVALGALALTTTACEGSRANKAGGSASSKPIVLTLATHDTLYAYGTFAAAVERLSGASIRIQVSNDWRVTQPDYERGIVKDVRAGKAQLGIVGARVWDTMGVTSFRPLLAPFLIDSLSLESRALQTAFAARALDHVEKLGVAGVAVLPGALRRPLALSRALVGAKDYRGATIGIRPGGTAEAALHALGARVRGYVPGSLSGLNGAELDLMTIATDGYDEQARALTSNVVLWPRIETIVANRKAFGALRPLQREILRRAGREAVEPELARIRADEAAALSAVCRRGKLSFLRASPADRAALQQAVQPLYEQLNRDPEARAWIAYIERMRGAAPASAPEAVRCSRAGTSTNPLESMLEGRWSRALTVEELIRQGAPPKLAEALRGRWIVDFTRGRFVLRNLETGGGGRGRYTVRGDIVRVVFTRGVGLKKGQTFDQRWSVYQDRLTVTALPGHEILVGLPGIWERVR